MATLPVYRTWVAGEVVTAAEMNSNVRDGGNFFLARPMAELRQTIVQSIPNGAWTSLTFDTEDADTDAGHSTVTNTSRYTGQTAGYYLLSGAYNPAINATGQRGTRWAVNASPVNASDSFAQAVTAVEQGVNARTRRTFLNGTTDYVELNVWQNSGGALNTVSATEVQSSMSVAWVHT